MMTTKRINQLALLQLEQYDTRAYLEKSNSALNPDISKRLKWTLRLRLTYGLAMFVGIVVANVLIGVIVFGWERLTWWWVSRRIWRLKHQGLKVVAIAGSYGKTSVKHYAYELLRREHRVVATPESYNTVLGIAKCIKWEVDDQTEILLVEIGAYRLGDIKRLLEMICPDIGVLTGMARQHLERFGSWENIQKAKMEIANYMAKTGGPLVANTSDKAVKENVDKLGVKAIGYGIGLDRNQINVDGAKKIAKLLGTDKFTSRIRPVKNRFEMTTQRYGMAVIDDSFSSNDKGFADALDYLGSQTKFYRILVTPGLVELGSESNKVHEELGAKIVGKADLVILVGDNERIASLERGIANKVEIQHIKKTLEFMGMVKSLVLKKEPLVLLENDVTENY